MATVKTTKARLRGAASADAVDVGERRARALRSRASRRAARTHAWRRRRSRPTPSLLDSSALVRRPRAVSARCARSGGQAAWRACARARAAVSFAAPRPKSRRAAAARAAGARRRAHGRPPPSPRALPRRARRVLGAARARRGAGARGRRSSAQARAPRRRRSRTRRPRGRRAPAATPRPYSLIASTRWLATKRCCAACLLTPSVLPISAQLQPAALAACTKWSTSSSALPRTPSASLNAAVNRSSGSASARSDSTACRRLARVGFASTASSLG